MSKYTIGNAIKEVLADHKDGLSYKDITAEILSRKLYVFNAKDPSAIVNHELRKHCEGLDFATAHPVKYYRIVSDSSVGGKAKYTLISDSTVTQSPSMESPIRQDDNDLLPEEEIQRYYSVHFENMQKQLLEKILQNPPEFFERLVVALLLKLGYGYNDESGTVLGRSHDGGIDGVINEDALGLDKIYIQAKRYAAGNSVGRPELQAFAGAMMDGGIKKGVFITTSTFSKAAHEFTTKQSEKYISLVDGNHLTEMMIQNTIGVRQVKSFSIYDLDTNFFEID